MRPELPALLGLIACSPGPLEVASVELDFEPEFAVGNHLYDEARAKVTNRSDETLLVSSSLAWVDLAQIAQFEVFGVTAFPAADERALEPGESTRITVIVAVESVDGRPETPGDYRLAVPLRAWRVERTGPFAMTRSLVAEQHVLTVAHVP